MNDYFVFVENHDDCMLHAIFFLGRTTENCSYAQDQVGIYMFSRQFLVL